MAAQSDGHSMGRHTRGPVVSHRSFVLDLVFSLVTSEAVLGKGHLWGSQGHRRDPWLSPSRRDLPLSPCVCFEGSPTMALFV